MIDEPANEEPQGDPSEDAVATPRLILFDKEGHIVEDVGGLLVANKAISERIADLLD